MLSPSLSLYLARICKRHGMDDVSIAMEAHAVGDHDTFQRHMPSLIRFGMAEAALLMRIQQMFTAPSKAELQRYVREFSLMAAENATDELIETQQQLTDAIDLLC